MVTITGEVGEELDAVAAELDLFLLDPGMFDSRRKRLLPIESLGSIEAAEIGRDRGRMPEPSVGATGPGIEPDFP